MWDSDKRTGKEHIMDSLLPLLAVVGFALLWIFVLPRLKGGT